MPTPDTTSCSHTREHRRSIQPRRLFHFQSTPLASPRTTYQQTTDNHQEDHWRFDFLHMRSGSPKTHTSNNSNDLHSRNFSQPDTRIHEPDSRRRGLWLSYSFGPVGPETWVQATMSPTVHCDGYGPTTGHLISIPSCHSGTYLHQALPFDWRPNSRFEILEKNPVTLRRLQHFERRPRAKNPTHVLVREKKSALLPCLWVSFLSTTHVAIVG